MNRQRSFPVGFAGEVGVHALHQSAQGADILDGDDLDAIAEGKDLGFLPAAQSHRFADFLRDNDLKLR